MKTKQLFTLLFLSLVSSKIFAQEILSNPELMCCLPKDSVSTSYNSKGQLLSRYSFKNGGVWNVEKYNENGTPEFVGTIKDGNGTLENCVLLNGTKKKNKVRTIGYYKNGKPNGNWQIYWDPEGTRLYSETIYQNGYVVSEISYDKEGRKKHEYTYNPNKLPKSIWEKNKEIVNSKHYEKGKLVQENKTEYKLHKRPKTTIVYYK